MLIGEFYVHLVGPPEADCERSEAISQLHKSRRKQMAGPEMRILEIATSTNELSQ
jgi:hypothetical protein